MRPTDRQRAYEALGLPDGAPELEVQRAYLRRVKTWHPDRFPPDSALHEQAVAYMRELGAAYEHLTAPTVRGAGRRRLARHAASTSGAPKPRARQPVVRCSDVRGAPIGVLLMLLVLFFAFLAFLVPAVADLLDKLTGVLID